MPSQKRKFGDAGEKIAEKYLKNKGYYIIERNYQRPWGEIDLIGRKDNRLIFFEVKTRDMFHVEHFLPEQAVNHSKQVKLKKICHTYLSDKKYPINQEWQIDIISIAIDKDKLKARVNHIENAVWA